MINKKLGISIPWTSRTNSLNIFNQQFIKKIIKNIFLKQNIYVSDIYIQEYPKLIYISFSFFLLNSVQYELSIKLKKLLNSFFSLVLKKNVFITFKLEKNLYNNVNILTNWLVLKLYNEPAAIKKILKQTIKQYDTITK